jgi:hypothetical protein
MLADWLALALQGVDPVTVKLPPESVPLKLRVFPPIEFVIVPVNPVPPCDTLIAPTGAVRVVAPLTPRPCPDCDTVAVPEELPWPWLDTVVTVQVPAKFRPELAVVLQPVREHVMPAARSTLRLAAAMRFMCMPSRANYKEIDVKYALLRNASITPCWRDGNGRLQGAGPENTRFADKEWMDTQLVLADHAA